AHERCERSPRPGRCFVGSGKRSRGPGDASCPPESLPEGRGDASCPLESLPKDRGDASYPPECVPPLPASCVVRPHREFGFGQQREICVLGPTFYVFFY